MERGPNSAYKLGNSCGPRRVVKIGHGMPPSSSKDAANSGTASLKGLRVLVVEDTWHVAKALKTALESMGLVVAGPAANAADAERLLAEHNPDLAVVDINLKGEMAYNLIDRMHERGVRVVVVSGYAVLPSAARNVAAILQKPFSGAELQATLRQVMQAGTAH
jgi:DNA-binding NtrC family response regulator